MSNKKEILATLAALTKAVEAMPDETQFHYAGGGCGELDRKITLHSHLGFDWSGGYKVPFQQSIHRVKQLADGVLVQNFEFGAEVKPEAL